MISRISVCNEFISKLKWPVLKKAIFYLFRLLFWTLLLSAPLWGTDYILNWTAGYIKPHFHRDSFLCEITQFNKNHTIRITRQIQK